MKHLRSDYDTVQDLGQTRCGRIHLGLETATSIGDDEPIFLLRAKDRLAPEVVRCWATALTLQQGDPTMVRAAFAWAAEMEAWQATHESKLPDAPAAVLRM